MATAGAMFAQVGHFAGRARWRRWRQRVAIGIAHRGVVPLVTGILRPDHDALSARTQRPGFRCAQQQRQQLVRETSLADIQQEVVKSEQGVTPGLAVVLVGEDGQERYHSMELVRLAFPRRMYTQSHFDFAAEVVAEVKADAARVRGVRIVKQAPFLRHFTCECEWA